MVPESWLQQGTPTSLTSMCSRAWGDHKQRHPTGEVHRRTSAASATTNVVSLFIHYNTMVPSRFWLGLWFCNINHVVWWWCKYYTLYSTEWEWYSWKSENWQIGALRFSSPSQSLNVAWHGQLSIRQLMQHPGSPLAYTALPHTYTEYRRQLFKVQNMTACTFF